MCFDTKRPLLKLCGCSGSIGYVHESCILGWITIKLEKMSTLTMPYCEICKLPYSAEIKKGKQKLSLRQLITKLK